MTCPAAGLGPLRISIDLSASNPVSGSHLLDGQPFEIIWPPGFTLRTSPEPAVVDSFGKVVAIDGQVIERAGGSPGPPAFICSIAGISYPLSP